MGGVTEQRRNVIDEEGVEEIDEKGKWWDCEEIYKYEMLAWDAETNGRSLSRNT